MTSTVRLLPTLTFRPSSSARKRSPGQLQVRLSLSLSRISLASHLHPSVDKERARKGLPPLQTCVIDVISSDSSKLDHEDAEILKQTKMSSTFIREWIATHPAR